MWCHEFNRDSKEGVYVASKLACQTLEYPIASVLIICSTLVAISLSKEAIYLFVQGDRVRADLAFAIRKRSHQVRPQRCIRALCLQCIVSR